MKTYPNQKNITIDKPKTFSNFALYGSEEIAKACSVLNGSAFKVWCYLLKNSSGVQWSVYPKDAENTWGIKHSTWRDGINELKEKGFLDDKAVHMISTKDENRPEYKTKSNQQKGELWFLEGDNQHRNNIKSGLRNTVSADASTNKLNKQPIANEYDDGFVF